MKVQEPLNSNNNAQEVINDNNDLDLTKILDNLFDEDNDHGVVVAHDGAIKDNVQ